MLNVAGVVSPEELTVRKLVADVVNEAVPLVEVNCTVCASALAELAPSAA
jgi:hypothetical protein